MIRKSHLSRRCLIVIALSAALCLLLFGCNGADGLPEDAPDPAFSGSQWEHTEFAIDEKDPDAILVAAIMETYATPGEAAPAWTYLFASRQYAKYFMVTNYSSKATAAIYGPTTWNNEVWEEAASVDGRAHITVDAPEAYQRILAENSTLADTPYSASIMVYEPAIEATEEAPNLLTWYFYFATEDDLARFNSSVETIADIASTTVLVNAQDGTVTTLAN